MEHSDHNEIYILAGRDTEKQTVYQPAGIQQNKHYVYTRAYSFNLHQLCVFVLTYVDLSFINLLTVNFMYISFSEKVKIHINVFECTSVLHTFLQNGWRFFLRPGC